MPGIEGAISNTDTNAYLITAEGLQIQGFAVVDSINERDSISSGLSTQFGSQTSRCGGFVAIVKDANGESNNTRAYMFVGSDSSSRNDGDYVTDSDWENPDNWVEISLGNDYLVDYAVTVQNVGGNNKYFLQSGEPGAANTQQPTLTLYRGMRYRFDYSDATAAGSHPFRIGTAANYNGSTSYDSGEGGVQIHHNIESSGKYYLDIVVQHNAPNTLYYHCSQHNGMGGSITVKNLTDGGGGLTTEQVQDIVGAMFGSNTQTRISATYQDVDGTIDLEVDDMTANDNTQNSYAISVVDGDDTTEEKIRLTQSGHDGANTDDIVLKAGTGLSISRSGDVITLVNDVSDTNTVYTAGDGLDLTGTTFSVDLKANGGVVTEGAGNELAVDLGASSITGTLAVSDGGTGATTLSNDGVLTGGGVSAITSESNVKVGQGVLAVSNSTSSSSGGIRFMEASDNGTAYTTLQAAADNLNSLPVITMPASTGTMALTSDIPTHTAGDGLTLTGVDFDIDAAQTTITSVLNANLKLGTAATDEYIDFGAASNIIRMAVNNSTVLDVASGGIEVSGNVDVGSNNVSVNGNVGDTINNDFVSFGTDGQVILATNNSARLIASDTGVSASNMNVTSELNSKKNIFEKTGDTNFSCQGDVVKIGTGSTTQGELCYYKSDGTWGAADADAVATSGGCLLAIALGTDPDVDGMLLRGMFTLDHDPGTIADELYVSTTAGDITGTAPSGNNDVVRVVGYCLDSTNGQIWFNPSNDYIEITA